MFDPNDKFHVYCNSEEPYEETEFLDNSLGYAMEQAKIWLHDKGGGYAEFHYINDERNNNCFLFCYYV